ncbi:MAG: hypothetical protein JO352_07320, partial [Chloroflexi bacterium]|nr:hypothetical protein [Chloroflexota bacterium]
MGQGRLKRHHVRLVSMWRLTASIVLSVMLGLATQWTQRQVVGSALAQAVEGGTWSGTGSMRASRVNQTATLLPDGKVLVAGGVAAVSGRAPSAELYDPTTGKWSTTGDMHTPRDSTTAALLLNGDVLVAGGDAGHSRLLT